MLGLEVQVQGSERGWSRWAPGRHLTLPLQGLGGEENEELVEILLADRKILARKLGIEIIVAAGSKDWLDTLDSLQEPTSRDSRMATRVLAINHGVDALPLLRAAHEKHPSNTTATAAIEELLLRQGEGE